jgi:hypothetical protein
MLDYAANAVVYWPVERLRATFEAACSVNGRDPAELVAELLDTPVTGPDVVDAFWQQVGTNLAAGELRLIFVADLIPIELRRVVEFLNTQMKCEVLAVEIRQFVGEGHSTLVPKLYGLTAAASQKSRSAGGQRAAPWTVEEFVDRVREGPYPQQLRPVQRIIDWARSRSLPIVGGLGAKEAYLSIEVTDRVTDESYRPLQLSVNNNARLYFQFSSMGPLLNTAEKTEPLRTAVREITGVAIGGTKQFAGIRLDFVEDHRKMEALTEALNQMVSVIERR